VSLLQKYKAISKDVKTKQVWVSGVAHITGGVEQLKKSPLEVRNLQIEGDIGEIFSSQINISSLDPLKYKPIIFDLKRVNLQNLLSSLNQNPAKNNMGSLGFFSGKLELASENSAHLVGEHQGLEFIFSNKGQRELHR
jgi:hypothetical protein